MHRRRIADDMGVGEDLAVGCHDQARTEALACLATSNQARLHGDDAGRKIVGDGLDVEARQRALAGFDDLDSECRRPAQRRRPLLGPLDPDQRTDQSGQPDESSPVRPPGTGAVSAARTVVAAVSRVQRLRRTLARRPSAVRRRPLRTEGVEHSNR